MLQRRKQLQQKRGTVDHSAQAVAGVDGCPGGWVIVTCRVNDISGAECRLCRTFDDVVAATADCELVCVDMPIGLPARSGIGGRAADVAARSRLGARQSSVFAVPSRAAVMASDYGEACRIAALTSDPPRKVAKQTFHLFPKIREIDAVMTPSLQNQVVECHPELAFWALNGGQPLTTPKKIKSRPNPEGLGARVQLLQGAGFDPAMLRRRYFLVGQVGPDDLIDAAACCATALRIAAGSALRVPDRPDRDERGLRMEIWA
jgi:predicted RNase H-like nuclease